MGPGGFQRASNGSLIGAVGGTKIEITMPFVGSGINFVSSGRFRELRK